MPVAKPRRLDVPASRSLFDRLQIEALHCAYGRAEVDAVARDAPALIVEHDGNVLLPLDHGDAIALAYCYRNPRAFADSFETMFERLLPRARKAYPSAATVRFRLTLGSARPIVEPVLRRLSFEQHKAWLQFSLEKTTLPRVSVARSVSFRDGVPGDLDELLAIDRESFPDTPVSREGLRRVIENGGRVLVATQRGTAAGFALFDHDTPGIGYLRTLAVRESHRRTGIGGALTMRVAKALFAEGAKQLDLRTDDDNATAIRLYTALGFRAAAAGIDYERPADPKVIERMRRENEGHFIKFGGWR